MGVNLFSLPPSVFSLRVCVLRGHFNYGVRRAALFGDQADWENMS